MNVLSLFDGMSCGQIALKELGIKVSKYYASEIDKFAIEQTRHNFPETVQLGSVENWQTWDIDFKSIDLVLAGSPCQGFSFAGKQLAFDDPRSRLFFVFIDILNHIKSLNPDVRFLLENVDMKRSHMKVITDYCGVYPVNINSNLLSAQNRNRWYWTNVKTKEHPVFGDLLADIPQPPDEGILLRDILDEAVDEKYYLSDKAIDFLGEDIIVKSINNTKATTLDANYFKGVGVHYGTCRQIVKGKQGAHSDTNVILQRKRGFNKGGLYESKSPSLSSNSWEQNNLVIQLNPSKESGGKQPYQQNRVYADYGKMPSLLAELGGRHNIYTNNILRRLTPAECARLQTIPDWYEWVVSDTQIYKMCGNGWTIKVIMWIFGFMERKTT